MSEKIEKYPNGNISCISHEDDNNILQGVLKSYFYNNKLKTLLIFKNSRVFNVCQKFFDYDENNIFYAREDIITYKEDFENGTYIKFHYEGDEERLAAREVAEIRVGYIDNDYDDYHFEDDYDDLEIDNNDL